METWRGHFPITHFVLHALLKKRAGADAARLSRAEAVLLAACQFWAAGGNAGTCACISLRSGAETAPPFEAFSEIAPFGSQRIAVALGDRPEVRSSTWLRQQALDLEARLLNTEDAVDHLIAQFASNIWRPGFVGEGVRERISRVASGLNQKLSAEAR